MPPQRWDTAGGAQHPFEALVGSAMQGFGTAQDFLKQRREERKSEEDRARRIRWEDILEQITLEQGGYTVDEGGEAQPTLPNRGPGGLDPRAGQVPAGPPARGTTGTMLPNEPRSGLPPMYDENGMPQRTPGIVPEDEPEPGGFFGKVGRALKRGAENFRTGGYEGLPQQGPRVRKTGPSSAERAAGVKRGHEVEDREDEQAHELALQRLRNEGDLERVRITSQAEQYRILREQADALDQQINAHIRMLDQLRGDPALRIPNLPEIESQRRERETRQAPLRSQIQQLEARLDGLVAARASLLDQMAGASELGGAERPPPPGASTPGTPSTPGPRLGPVRSLDITTRTGGFDLFPNLPGAPAAAPKLPSSGAGSGHQGTIDLRTEPDTGTITPAALRDAWDAAAAALRAQGLTPEQITAKLGPPPGGAGARF